MTTRASPCREAILPGQGGEFCGAKHPAALPGAGLLDCSRELSIVGAHDRGKCEIPKQLTVEDIVRLLLGVVRPLAHSETEEVSVDPEHGVEPHRRFGSARDGHFLVVVLIEEIEHVIHDIAVQADEICPGCLIVCLVFAFGDWLTFHRRAGHFGRLFAEPINHLDP